MKPRDTQIPISTNALRKLVGWPLDIAPLGDHAAIVWGIKNIGTYDKCGAFAICGLNGEMLTSLHPYLTQKYKREFTPCEREEKKPSLKERLDETKKAMEKLNQAAAIDKPAKARKKDGLDI